MSAADPAKIQAAIDIYAEPNRWTLGFYARDKNNHCVGPLKPTAVTFDIEGVLLKAGCDTFGPEWAIVNELVNKRDFESPHAFNIAIGCSQVACLVVLRQAKAIALQRARPVLELAS